MSKKQFCNFQNFTPKRVKKDKMCSSEFSYFNFRKKLTNLMINDFLTNRNIKNFMRNLEFHKNITLAHVDCICAKTRSITKKR